MREQTKPPVAEAGAVGASPWLLSAISWLLRCCGELRGSTRSTGAHNGVDVSGQSVMHRPVSVQPAASGVAEETVQDGYPLQWGGGVAVETRGRG